MKKVLFYSLAVLALASCSNDEFLGVSHKNNLKTDGAILFSPNNAKQTRANTVGQAAANILGKNFIVEGFKGSEGTTQASTNVVFDNYLVVWGQNTAGTTQDNTNDWSYVGVDHSDHMTAAILNGAEFNRDVKSQTIKYWDYSTDRYDFVAYSTGQLNMIASGDPVPATSIKVSKIASPVGANAFSFKAASAADLVQCYYTDVTPVLKANYGNPVQLTFKNLSAKVRIGLYETVPGYSVKDVEFYADNTVPAAAVYTVVAAGSDLTAGETYYTSAVGAGEFVEPSPATHTNVAADTYWTLTSAAVPAPVASGDATFFLSSGTFPDAGTITVSYAKLGTDNTGNPGYNKATVTVTPESSTTTTMTFGTLAANYSDEEAYETAGTIYLGRTLADATMAGVSGNNYFTPVIPVATGAALTLRCNYTLVSTDGSNEQIKVWGAKAVVPASYCTWQPNYAYTYIFKISDNTNGSTEKLGGTENLFPITFDAVVAGIADANAEQATVTTVATPSVTTYQESHTNGNEYAAGKIYVEVMQDGDLATLTGKTTLYTITDNTATEADVIDALQMGTATLAGVVTGRNGLVLTPADPAIDLGAHSIPAVDGTTIDVAAGKSGEFTAVASKNYVFVYDYTAGSPAATPLYSYDQAASTAEPSDWSADTDNPYYTKDGDGTYTQVTTAWAAGVYYKKYENNNHTYAVKVIKTGTAY